MANWGSKSILVLVMACLSMSLVSAAEESATKLDRTNMKLMDDVRYWCDQKCLIENDVVFFCVSLNKNLQDRHNVSWKSITIDGCKVSGASEENYNPTTTTTVPPSTSQDSNIKIETTSAPVTTKPTTSEPSTNATESINEQPSTTTPADPAVPDSDVTYLAWVIPLIALILLGMAIGGFYINRYAKKAGYQHSTKATADPVKSENGV